MDELIDLLPRLLDEQPDLCLLIAGEGDDRLRLESKVLAAGLQAAVRFTGRVPEVEKADHYRLCDVFSMVGRQEGFGFVFLEAMACGIPVVASLRDGSREAVRDGAMGQLADPDDPDSLQSAILTALRQPRGIPEGLDFFAFPQFCARLTDLMDSMMTVRGFTQ